MAEKPTKSGRVKTCKDDKFLAELLAKRVAKIDGNSLVKNIEVIEY